MGSPLYLIPPRNLRNCSKAGLNSPTCRMDTVRRWLCFTERHTQRSFTSTVSPQSAPPAQPSHQIYPLPWICWSTCLNWSGLCASGRWNSSEIFCRQGDYTQNNVWVIFLWLSRVFRQFPVPKTVVPRWTTVVFEIWKDLKRCNHRVLNVPVRLLVGSGMNHPVTSSNSAHCRNGNVPFCLYRNLENKDNRLWNLACKVGHNNIGILSFSEREKQRLELSIPINSTHTVTTCKWRLTIKPPVVEILETVCCQKHLDFFNYELYAGI